MLNGMPPATQDEIPKENVIQPPLNIGSAPFAILVELFLKLQSEKKPERRRQYLQSWFTVCTLLNFLHASYLIQCMLALA